MSDKNNIQRRHWFKGGLAVLVFLVATKVLTGCGMVTIVAMNQIKTTHFEIQDNSLLMRGVINSKTLAQFEDIIAENPNITTLVELDVPGSVDDDTMIALSYRVRELGLNTHLTANSEIYSGGVDLYLAGVKRSMEPGATIGVHSWSDGSRDAKDYPRDSPAHEQNRLYIERMLDDDAFYWFTIYAAPADGMHVMTGAEIRKYKLVNG
ncbi:alpha/beta hydrolase [Phaeobacter sp. C3_T13_0]|uniref:COG3904 family protein n=1 Tax=Phaeobacter cretensis TaxID=3342641 RepID=UPI0039BCC850